MEQDIKFYLSLALLQDEKTGGYTAFYTQFPEAIAQGSTKEEAAMLLNEILSYALEERQSEFMQYHKDVEVIQKPFYA